MHISKVLDIDGTFEKTKALKVGDKLTVQGFNVKTVEQVGAEVAEIKTTTGVYHSFGKAVIGQAKSEWWNNKVKECLNIDASDGLDVTVIERPAEKTGRMMVSLSAFDNED